MKKKKVTKKVTKKASKETYKPKEIKLPRYETPEEFEWAENQIISSIPSPSQQLRMNDIIRGAVHLTHCVQMHCPPSHERAMALAKLEELKLWANRAIILNERDGKTP